MSISNKRVMLPKGLQTVVYDVDQDGDALIPYRAPGTNGGKPCRDAYQMISRVDFFKLKWRKSLDSDIKRTYGD